MSTKELKKLKLNERVKWSHLRADDPIGGTVIERGYSGIRVKWDDEHLSTFFFERADDERLQHLSK